VGVCARLFSKNDESVDADDEVGCIGAVDTPCGPWCCSPLALGAGVLKFDEVPNSLMS